MTTPEPIVELDTVTKVFATEEVETHALADVHLEIHRGEYVSIEGPSGSGKTTLLSILGLLDEPTRGTYRLAGERVEAMPAAKRARVRGERIGFVFQSFNLIGELSALENVELPLAYRRLPASERRERALRALDRVGMSHRAKHMPHELSGGQQQRVAVARAIVGEPALLLADEPTGNLDSHHGDKVMELIRELHKAGATVCTVTHNPEYAKHASRVVHLFDGRIVGERAP